LVRRNDTVRLISTRYRNSEPAVLSLLADSADDLEALAALEELTNDRLLAEQQLLPGIGIHELIFDLPYAPMVNAAFTHAHPNGSRFNGPDRGAWYAAFEIATAQAEIAFHYTVALLEVNRLHEEMTFDAYLADFSGLFHDIRNQAAFRDWLDPASYVRSQQAAQELMRAGSLGLVYPSVRRPSGTCLACFRPALVSHVRRGNRYLFTWSGSPTPSISELTRM